MTPPLMQSKINKAFEKFDFLGQPGLLLYWACTPSKKGVHLTVIKQPFRLTDNDNHKVLENYRRNLCFKQSNGSEVPELSGEHFFARVAAQTGLANQRTKYDHGQSMGQLVVPVYGVKEVVGVIELVTVLPKGSYAEYFNQIRDLLKEENLTTEIKKEVAIKVEYRGNTIKFLLSFASGMKCLLEEVGKRRNLQQHFEIKYTDSEGKTRSISTDNDVHDYIAFADSSSKKGKNIKLFVY